MALLDFDVHHGNGTEAYVAACRSLTQLLLWQAKSQHCSHTADYILQTTF